MFQLKTSKKLQRESRSLAEADKTKPNEISIENIENQTSLWESGFSGRAASGSGRLAV